MLFTPDTVCVDSRCRTVIYWSTDKKKAFFLVFHPIKNQKDSFFRVYNDLNAL